ncbi:hypothetical protein HU200_039982 [Digitaria exilis]|uniref:Uncharacterized protein n=1 Tax=Digitaria exilis TaxID=1010633 RepID=A0A835EKI6_9POAL|nr:hypothetical protein HU200_039982 [Digitaria exilis]
MDEAAMRQATLKPGVVGETGMPLVVLHSTAATTTQSTRAEQLPLRVTAEFDQWPEMDARRREWVSPAQAAEAIAWCHHTSRRKPLTCSG